MVTVCSILSKTSSHWIPNTQFLEKSMTISKVSEGDAGPHFWKLVRCLKRQKHHYSSCGEELDGVMLNNTFVPFILTSLSHSSTELLR